MNGSFIIFCTKAQKQTRTCAGVTPGFLSVCGNLMKHLVYKFARKQLKHDEPGPP